MSSEDLARVRKLHRKALELDKKGHTLRAAEIYGRAADAAARILEPGPDNLVTVGLLRCQAVMVSAYCGNVANTNGTVDPNVLAAHRAEVVALYSTAVAALERRRAAGTLLEGKCTAAEEAYEGAYLRESSCPPAEAASLAKLVGYGTFLLAARHVQDVLRNAFFFEGECSAAQFETLTQFVVSAADLMQLPRSHGTNEYYADVCFSKTFFEAVPHLLSGTRGLDTCLVQLLTDASQRLQRSGVLEVRGILDERRHLMVNASHQKKVAAMNSAMSAPGLRSCALEGCGAREAHPQHFKSCAACRTVVYCRREHQMEGWAEHKVACKAARRAAAASDGGAGPDAS
jgi:hypothetical protein